MNRRNFLASIVAAIVGGELTKQLDWKLTLRNFFNGVNKPVYSYRIPRAWRTPIEPFIPSWKRAEWQHALLLDELDMAPSWAVSKSQFLIKHYGAVDIPVVTIQDARDILGLPEETV